MAKSKGNTLCEDILLCMCGWLVVQRNKKKNNAMVFVVYWLWWRVSYTHSLFSDLLSRHCDFIRTIFSSSVSISFLSLHLFVVIIVLRFNLLTLDFQFPFSHGL